MISVPFATELGRIYRTAGVYLEFVAHEVPGAAIGHVSGLARVDFDAAAGGITREMLQDATALHRELGEPARPAAFSIPFGTLPLSTFIRGPQYRVDVGGGEVQVTVVPDAPTPPQPPVRQRRTRRWACNYTPDGSYMPRVGDLLVFHNGDVFEVRARTPTRIAIRLANRWTRRRAGPVRSRLIVNPADPQFNEVYGIRDGLVDLYWPTGRETADRFNQTMRELGRLATGTVWFRPVHAERRAVDAINEFTRVRMREDGFFRRILPPIPISNEELDRSVDTDLPVRVVDAETRAQASRPQLSPEATRVLNEALFDALANPRRGL